MCIWVYRQPRPSPTCRWERPLPFASALEPGSRRHASKRGNGLARAIIDEPLASCPDPAFKEGAQDKNPELALNHRGRHQRVAVHVVEGLEFRRRQHLIFNFRTLDIDLDVKIQSFGCVCIDNEGSCR